MAGIWVFADNRDRTLELLNAGRSLADRMSARVAAFATEERFAGEYIACGADTVYVHQALAEGQPFESCLPVLADLARAEDPDVILVGATGRGKEIGARLAARLDAGLCSGCVSFDPDDSGKSLKMNRLVYGGAATQTVVCQGRPQMATVPPRTFEPAAAQEGRTGEIVTLPPPPPSSIRVIGRSAKQRDSVDVTEAKIIVCVGRGFEKKEDISLARDLARVLNGEVGCSRPVAEELQWLPEEVYLGISGKKVKPVLYVGLGVSGQVQHITGIRDSKVILAVNRDENAPIFEAADFGIVGDLYQVVPKLIEELKQALEA
ncbi:MAG: electron transfer flavoprotein subunit alpha/FixB family protein [Desulfobacteraceae bacterium]|nr:electron transfer flavoprotein subunit alpha/FixB family protein [Desulfobacteraceae bacterium]